MAENKLYYGDNLTVLRERDYIRDESVDLVYLDPPFKSNQDYNVLFAEKDGTRSAAQIEAFEDTWQWDDAAALACNEIIESGGRIAETMIAFRQLLGGSRGSDMLAYLAMMAPRLVELRRVLKPTGSIYLHCDPTASHYLKLLLDAVFGPTMFRNEIIWQRTNAKTAMSQWPRLHDVLLLYSKAERPRFTPLQVPADSSKMPHTLITGPDGKKYQTYELTAPHLRFGETGLPWRGFQPAEMGRCWANPPRVMDEWDRAGLIHWPKKKGAWPRRRDANPFEEAKRVVTVGDVWADIDRINQSAKERLGYPTQKPKALLERIIRASSDEGDVVLDPFCGCGTAVEMAQQLKRRWIGIDITYLAIGLIKRRLADAFGDAAKYDVIGEPTTAQDAKALAEQDKYQFQWWALDLVHARPAKAVDRKKGADRGVDGRLYFHDDTSGSTRQVIISVKGGGTGADDVRDLRGALERERAEIGVLISLQEPTKPMRKEAADGGFWKSHWRSQPYAKIQLLTVAELLEGSAIDMPPVRQVSTTFKVAPTESEAPFRSPVRPTKKKPARETKVAEDQPLFRKRPKPGDGSDY